ncbi:DMT family transporter [Coriobacteriales bacterium OH1046]|nr:DMT family transporter [Coriobacteriales bacterium OH1046]
MMRFHDIPVWVWKAALALVAAIWGGAFVVVKGALDDAPPVWMLALRFGATAAILCVVFHRRLKEHLDAGHLCRGTVLGSLSGPAFMAQFAGLADTTPSKSAFITATYCVLVPFLNWIIVRRHPRSLHLVAAALALAGIGFISFGRDFSMVLTEGDFITFACAVLFALHIVCVARYAQDSDIMTLTIVQIAVSAGISLVWAVAFEPFPALGAAGPDFWVSFAYLVILSSCFAMVVQNVAQSIVEPATAALLLSLESVFAVVFSVVFYHEALTPRLIVGFVLIFLAILVSETLPPLLGKSVARNVQAESPHR